MECAGRSARQARLAAMRARLADLRVRVEALPERAAAPPRAPVRPDKPTRPRVDPGAGGDGPGPVVIDPSCLANPLCIKR